MKSKFKSLLLLLAFSVFAIVAGAQENTRKYSKSWPSAEVETLEIVNKFGDVKINNTTGNAVVVEAVVSAEGSSESRTRELLEKITVFFDKTGNKAYAETKFGADFKGSNKFSINYTVSVPADKNLIITNKFGNVVVNELNAKGNFNVQYGNLTANKLNGPGLDGITINLEYGKGDISTLSDAKITASYANKVYLGKVGTLNLESKYTGLEVDQVKTLLLSSKYDSFNLGEVSELTGESKYSNFKIKMLQKKLKLTTGYGSVKAEKVARNFEAIEIVNSFGQISLGIEEGAAYDMNTSCQFCDISYPKDHFNGNSMEEKFTRTVVGKVGGTPSGRVSVTSKYGNIRLVP